MNLPQAPQGVCPSLRFYFTTERVACQVQISISDHFFSGCCVRHAFRLLRVAPFPSGEAGMGVSRRRRRPQNRRTRHRPPAKMRGGANAPSAALAAQAPPRWRSEAATHPKTAAIAGGQASTPHGVRGLSPSVSQRHYRHPKTGLTTQRRDAAFRAAAMPTASVVSDPTSLRASNKRRAGGTARPELLPLRRCGSSSEPRGRQQLLMSASGCAAAHRVGAHGNGRTTGDAHPQSASARALCGMHCVAFLECVWSYGRKRDRPRSGLSRCDRSGTHAPTTVPPEGLRMRGIPGRVPRKRPGIPPRPKSEWGSVEEAQACRNCLQPGSVFSVIGRMTAAAPLFFGLQRSCQSCGCIPVVDKAAQADFIRIRGKAAQTSSLDKRSV